MARTGIFSRGISYAALCAGVYTLFGIAWITLSDRVVEVLIPDNAQLSLFQTYKGWLFVLATALLIYVLLRRAGRGARSGSTGDDLEGAAPPGIPIVGQLVLLVLAVGTPLCALLALSIYRSAEVEVANAKRLVEDLARITARDTAKFVDATAQALSTMAQRPLVRALDPASCDPMLADVPVINPAYVNALTLDANGRMICSVLPVPPDAQLRFPQSAHHRRVLREGIFMLGEPVAGPLSGRAVVVASAPVRDARGAVAGSVNLSIDLESLRPVVRPVLPKSGIVGLVNSAGVVVYGENAKRRGQDGRDAEIVRLAIAQKTGEGQARGFDGVMRSY